MTNLIEKRNSVSIKFFLLILTGLCIASPAWYLVSFQLKYISTVESLFYRFIIAAFFIELCRHLISEKTPERLSLKVWGLLVAQGICFFGINFLFLYEASKHMISGLIPVFPAILFVPAMIIDRLTSREKVSWEKIVGSCAACFGLFLLFYDEVINVDSSHLYGCLLGCISIIFTLGGTYISKKIFKEYNLPLLWVTARALFFGAIFFLFLILFNNGFSGFSVENDFLFSLLYLAIGVTVSIMLLHTYMVKHYGAASASFLWALVPTATLFISALFEGYVWTFATIGGLLCIIFGALLNYGILPVFDWKTMERKKRGSEENI
ncbi:MAG: DMT family transporter [Alphaproteobacteria bacterium]|nr:DMT family transporter [Alphaproteobacteria bacterium]